MKFKVRRKGANLGEFTLDELVQRRGAGELSGEEYVQLEGAEDWQPLDLVLQEGYRTGLPTPPPLAQSGTTAEKVIWGSILAAVLVVIFFGALFVRLAYRAGQTRITSQQNRYSRISYEVPIAASVRPILYTTNSETVADFNRRAREFRTREWIDGYKQRGQRNPECDQEVIAFLEAWIADNYGGPDVTNQISLEDESDKLAADPQCTDPLVLTVVGINNRNLFQARHCLERALAAFPGSQHQAYPQFYATLMLVRQLGNGDRRVRSLQESALPLLSKCFADGSFGPEDQREIAELFVNDWARGLFQADPASVCNITHLAGADYRWLALCLDGEHEIAEAWAARGGGYSDSVTSQGWQGFSAHLAAARSDLTKAWAMHPTWALAPERMIYVSLGDSDIDEMRLWFDRTTTAQIDYNRAYSDFRWGLRPRWYGNEASLLAFGAAAVNTGRFDTDVPRKYFDAIKDVESELNEPAGQHIYGRADIWPSLSRMYQGYVAAPSQSDCRTAWRTTYAVVAYFAGKYDLARAQLAATDWKPSPVSLTGWGVDLSQMPLEVAARTGTLGPKVSAAEEAAKNEQFADAYKLYQGMAQTSPEPRTGQYIGLRISQLGIAEQLLDGAWVNWLPATTNDPNWAIKFGRVRTLPDGALEVESGTAGHMLFSRIPVGSSFEVRGQFENVRSSNKNFQAGLVMGMPDFNGYDWYGFRLKRHDEEGDVVCFAEGWTTRQQVMSAMLHEVTNSFDFTFRLGKVSATVNGVPVFLDVTPPEQISVPANDYLVGLGAFSDSSDNVIRYRNVQLRRLF